MKAKQHLQAKSCAALRHSDDSKTLALKGQRVSVLLCAISIPRGGRPHSRVLGAEILELSRY